jgi:hypothetical protein
MMSDIKNMYLEVQKMETNEGGLDYIVDRQPVLDLLIDSTVPEGLDLKTQKSFFGLATEPDGVPIDVLAIALLGRDIQDYTLLIVDEFQRMAGMPENLIQQARTSLESELDLFAKTFNLNFNVRYASEIMHRKNYEDVLGQVRDSVTSSEELTEQVRATIPSGRDKSDLSYTLNQLAVVQSLAEEGFTAKVGQQRERLYDTISGAIEPNINFAYLIPFYALGTEELVEVTPYTLSSGKKKGGERIETPTNPSYAEGLHSAMRLSLLKSPDKTKLSLHRLSLSAALARGLTVPTEGIEAQLYPLGVVNDFFKHIIAPYLDTQFKRNKEGL